ncbi:IclR family transcriptional regulator [Sphingomonas sp. UYEF23]|uniref:IclR family transcriptional regulator n=1 Tax=Sphingomonas sp. UYEF23 TaxID=1756408 RepID=UPI0033979C7B
MSERNDIVDLTGVVKGAQTLMRALDIMDEVIAGPIRLTDLAQKLCMSKTTTHRLVAALASRKYLHLTPTGFGLGPKLIQMGVIASEQVNYINVARPAMELLSERTGFCVFSGKREGDWLRYVDRVTGQQRLRLSAAPGDFRPIAETGMGKALLLDEGEPALVYLYKQATGEAPESPRGIQFLDSMRINRRRGLVLHDSESDNGVRSVAAPVRDAGGRICMAISIASAAHYLTDSNIGQLAEQLARSVKQVSTAIGYKGNE